MRIGKGKLTPIAYRADTRDTQFSWCLATDPVVDQGHCSDVSQLLDDPLVARCHPVAAELARAWRITNSKNCVTMPMLPELCDFVTCGWIEPQIAGCVKSREIRDSPATVFSFRSVTA
jgi:hypothetical protein